MDYPLVSVITLNYGQARVTCEFLESCRFLTYPNFEVIVCDMKSDENPLDFIDLQSYPYARLYLNPRNLGFAAGNNWGIEKAEGDFFFIVNNDTEVTPNVIELLLHPFLKEDNVGVVCPKINFYEKKDTIQYVGFSKINPISGRSKTKGYLEKDRGQFDKLMLTSAPHGAGMMLKKEVIKKAGGFPESFFLYYEEMDLGARILNAGYKIYVQGNALIYHKESISVGKSNPIKQYYLTRNRILYMRRNSNIIQFSLFALFFMFFTVPKTVIIFTFKRRYSHLKAFFRGIWDNLLISTYSVT